MFPLCVLLLIVSFHCMETIAECVDGVNNVISIQDVGGDDASVRFSDLQLLTYGEDEKPHCENGVASVRFPGHLKLISGNVIISKALKKENGRLIVEVSAEQNSFLIGKMCVKGKSKSSYLKDADCQVDICKLLGEKACSVFRQEAELSFDDMPKAFRNKLMPLPAAATEMLTGEWKMKLYLKQAGKVVGAALVGRPKEWTNVVATSYREEL